MVEPVTILFLGIPRLERDLIERAVGAGTTVLGAIATSDDLRRTIEELDPQVVLLRAAGGRLPRACDAIFELRPRIKFLVFGAGWTELSLYSLKPARSPLGEISMERLLAAVRQAARSPLAGVAA